MDFLEDILYRKGFPLLGELAFWDLYSEISDKGHSGSEKDKPPNKGQAESTPVYTLYRKSPLKENNLSTKDKTGPLLDASLFSSLRTNSERTMIVCYLPMANVSVSVYEREGEANNVPSSIDILTGPHVL